MSKAELVKKAFEHFIGSKLIGYSIAEVFYEEWEPWNDLPIRLHFDNGGMVAAAWSRFHDLWLSNDLSLPFDIYDSKIRWVENNLPELNPLLGGVMISVSLGQGTLAVEDRDIHLDTRLLMNTDRGVLDIYNALDENGYALMLDLPEETRLCVL